MPTIFKGLFLTLVMAAFWLNPVAAQNNSDHQSHPDSNSHSEGKFDAGKFVIEHVIDAYDWHIASFGEKHFSIPLPVILYSNNPGLHGGKKLHVFMSSKFHHGHDDYNGFRISHSEKFNGKIVELDEQVHEIGRPTDLSITKVVAGAIVSAIVLLSLLFAAAHTARHNRGRAPSGTQNLIEPVI